MGIPKFNRFINDRYPCINKIVKGYEIPEYDNLYLDMNSIVHDCSHPSDSDIHFRIGKKEFFDEHIYQNVCRYIEIIFFAVKPINLMYLAFDGVAPRAKINQQRGHRFRVAKDIDEMVKSKVMYNTVFDANCITTGTVFMTELIDYVQHFIAYKISTNFAWKKCKIILSGPEVPGEGEHKIMEYIRYNKAQSNYNGNTRHCLYGFDADLIILGLCTHEPHFSLMRKKVTFGNMTNMLTPEESDFELLHLSLLREYLKYEFTSIKSKLKFPFNLEKIIDDWVLIGFLVGNDFIPQLPNLNIVHGALPLIFNTYMNVLPNLDGYINDCGELNITRFKRYIQMLSQEFLVNKFESKDGISEDNSKEVLDINKVKPFLNKDVETKNQLIEDAFKTLDLKCDKNKIEHPQENDETSLIVSSINEKKKQILLEIPVDLNAFKAEYYENKFGFYQTDRKNILVLVEQYIKAIQWTLRYYYQGCCSWSWYYPYHYAPHIFDIEKLQNITFDFTMGTPFLPLQHLLAVLPPTSVHLLPKPLHFLLTNQESPIIDFYPKDFEVDLNGKTNDWESIVLIPFIDENKLINAMEPYIKSLSFRERKRNTNGSICMYTYTHTNLGQYPVETIFGSFVNHAQLEHIKVEDMHVPKKNLVQGLCCNVSFNLSFSGFPTLKYVSHSFKLENTHLKSNTYNQYKIESMILSVSPKLENGLKDLAKVYLGQTAYAYWPHLKEARIIGITDFKKKIILKNFWKGYNEDNVKTEELLKLAKTKLHDETKLMTNIYKDLLGIEIGETNILFYIFPIIGKKYVCGHNGNVQLQVKYSQSLKTFPCQLIVEEKKVQRYSSMLYKTINELFVISSTCFVISQPNYGAKGQIKGIIAKQQLISVVLELSLQPDFSSSTDKFFIANSTYMSCNDIANKLKMNSTLISRITGSFIVTEESSNPKYHDIGLHIKYPKYEKELFGYTKKDNKIWLYSEKALQLIQSYINEFRYLFENLIKNVNLKSSTFALSDLFPGGLAQLNVLKVWLAKQESQYTTFLECCTETLGLNGVPELEKQIANFYLKGHKKRMVSTRVKARSLFIPGTLSALVPPDFNAKHKLLDRLVCVKNYFTVPLGLNGTIIGIQEKADKCQNVYTVLFDSPFTDGLTLYGSSEHRCYRLLATDFINISSGQRYLQNLRQPDAAAMLKI